MSMDFAVACHICQKYIWFGKISIAGGEMLSQNEKAAVFMHEHANCCIKRALIVCTL